MDNALTPDSDPESTGSPATQPGVPDRAIDSSTNRNKFWIVLKVIEVRLRFIAILVAVGLVIGYWDTIKNYYERWTVRSPSAEQAGDSDSEYFCPMHPSVVRPGLEPNGEIPKCPICGMKLSHRRRGESQQLPDGVLARVQFSPERIRLGGIQTVPVSYQFLSKEIRTVGYVGYDESRLSKIVTRTAGYLERLYVDRTWQTVAEGDALAQIYSPELYSAVRELALASSKNLKDLEKSGRERLRLLGIEDSEIDKIIESGANDHRLVIRSPRSGHIIRKEVVQGDHVESGKTLFEIADLTSVWVEADVYEKDVPFLRVGQVVEATVEAVPNRVFQGHASLVHPHLEPITRTNAVRIELDNQEHELRPGMFASVRIKVPLGDIEPFKSLAAGEPLATAAIRTNEPRELFSCPSHPEVMMDRAGECPKCTAELESRPLNDDERLIWWCPMHPQVTSDAPGASCADCGGMKLVPRLLLAAKPGEVLAIPERSVIDTGRSKIVYVERSPGLFDAVEVELGPRAGGFYPVVAGLHPGEQIAAAGAFLVDAETRLNPATTTSYLGSARPVGPNKSRGVQVHKKSADRSARGSRKTTPADSAASPDDLKNLDSLDPDDRSLALTQARCPITNQPLGSMGAPYKMTINGRVIFLCCRGCESKVKQDPEKVLKLISAPGQ